jgi:trimethylamine--corrinoid protein Co-methyltransferase
VSAATPGSGQPGTAAPGARRLRRQPLAPLRADCRLQRHGPQRLEPYLEAVYAVLAGTGVKCRSRRGVALFAKAGAEVHEASGLVRLPRRLVEETLALAPRTFVLGSRDGLTDLDLATGETYGTTDGSGTDVVDRRTGERRPSTKADLADVTRMQDYLGSVAFWWPTVGAGDCGPAAQVHELEAGWNNTTKHLMGMVQGEALARCAVQMATAVADARGPGAPPVLSDLIGTVSPLVLDDDGTSAGLVFGEAGIPVCYVTMPTLGTTAPATPAGALVVGAAEIVAAAVLHQLAAPGAPVWGSIMSSYADPRNALTLSAPLEDRCRFLSTELLHAFGLPSLGAFGGTDATEPGTWQHGVEQAAQLLQLPLDGCETYTGIGLHGTYTVFAPEDLILDDDLYHRARAAFRELAAGEEELALEAIAAVGPGGNFLAHTHTRRHMRDTVVRAITQQVAADGRHYREALEVARERAHDILEHYEPAPLGDDTRRELRRLVAAADGAAHDHEGGSR